MPAALPCFLRRGLSPGVRIGRGPRPGPTRGELEGQYKRVQDRRRSKRPDWSMRGGKEREKEESVVNEYRGREKVVAGKRKLKIF